MAKKRRKTSKKRGSGKMKRRVKANQIPLPILVRRLKRLSNIVKSRAA